MISGEERVAKPDPEVFHRLWDRYALSPHTSVFVDDAEANTTAADGLGFRSVLFTSPDQLCREFEALGLFATTT